MERKLRVGLLILLAVFYSVLADGKLSFGRCPEVQVPSLEVKDILGTWFVALETGGEKSCVSYKFEALPEPKESLITKTSLGSNGEYDFDYGALAMVRDSPHFIWPGTFEVKSGSIIKYDEGTMGLFTCDSRGLLRTQTAYLLSKTGLVPVLALAAFVQNVIDFQLHSDDFEKVNQDSCPRVLITSMAGEPNLHRAAPTSPTTTTTTTTTTTPTTVRTPIRLPFDDSNWHSPNSGFDIPWLPALPHPPFIPETPWIFRQSPTTTARPVSSTRKPREDPWLPRPMPPTPKPVHTTPPTTEEWTIVGFVDVVEHEADTRSEEASRELEF